MPVLTRRILHSDPEAALTPRYVRVAGTNREIGAALGGMVRDAHGLTLENIEVPDAPLVAARRRYLAALYPEFLARGAGVADTLGISPDDPVHDPTWLLYNTELPGFGCSVAYYPGSATASGHSYLSRNFDYPTGTFADFVGLPLDDEVKAGLRPFAGDPYVVELHPSDGGHSSIAVMAVDLLSGAFDGINSEGLVVSILADGTALERPHPGPRVGLFELQVTRMLLDTCANVEEAREALLTHRQYTSMQPLHYIIGDASGRSFIYERDPVDQGDHFIECDGGPQCITNHLLFENETPDPDDLALSASHLRLDELSKAARNGGGSLEVDAIVRANRDVNVSSTLRKLPDFGADSPQGPVRTLWYSLYDIDARSLSIRFYTGDSEENGHLVEQFTEAFEFGLGA